MMPEIGEIGAILIVIGLSCNVFGAVFLLCRISASATRSSIFTGTRKKNGVEDIKKAIWYLNKYVELEEGK